MISGLVLTYLNGECFVRRRGYKASRPVSSSFCLTIPEGLNPTKQDVAQMLQSFNGSARDLIDLVEETVIASKVATL